MEYTTNDSDALFEGLEDLGEVTAEQSAIPTPGKPQVASVTEAFDDEESDMPF